MFCLGKSTPYSSQQLSEDLETPVPAVARLVLVGATAGAQWSLEGDAREQPAFPADTGVVPSSEGPARQLAPSFWREGVTRPRNK